MSTAISDPPETRNEGIVLQLQSFSLHDGDGVRTVIFLPGCPLRCLWCANPETWTAEPKPVRYANKAPQILNSKMTAGEVFRKIRREEVFFRYSGGGVTFSGGEPFAQLPFLRALTRLFGDAGIDMWIETSGHFSWDEGADIFSNLSHVFLDLKCMDPGDHRRYTGQDNGIILANAVNIYKTGIPLTIRIPCVKNLNFTEKNLRATAGFMKEALPGAELEFLPYHDLGKEKYSALGMESFFHQFSAPGREELMWGKAIFQELGLKVVSYS